MKGNSVLYHLFLYLPLASQYYLLFHTRMLPDITDRTNYINKHMINYLIHDS